MDKSLTRNLHHYCIITLTCHKVKREVTLHRFVSFILNNIHLYSYFQLLVAPFSTDFLKIFGYGSYLLYSLSLSLSLFHRQTQINNLAKYPSEMENCIHL